MTKEITIYSGMVLDEYTRFSLVELCVLAKTSAEWVIELVDEGVLEPEGVTVNEWRFDARALKRLQAARRLQLDLGVNLPGVALILDLLEEVEALRQQLHRSS